MEQRPPRGSPDDADGGRRIAGAAAGVRWSEAQVPSSIDVAGHRRARETSANARERESRADVGEITTAAGGGGETTSAG